MPIVPDYPCHCGDPWEDAANCPDCGATCSILVCSNCDGLLDDCIACETRDSDAEEQY